MNKYSKRFPLFFLVVLFLFAFLPNASVKAGTSYKVYFNKSSFYYTGKKIVPSVVVRSSNKKKVSASKYTISYINQSKKSVKSPCSPGTYTVSIKFKDKKTKAISKNYKIVSTKYYIKFDSNGGSGEMEKLTCKTSKCYLLSANEFAKEAYKFAGWNTKADGTGKEYSNQQKITNLSFKNNKTITLYAQWSPIKSHRQTGSFSSSYKSSKFYKNLQKVEGNLPQNERIAQVALSQVDYHESDSSKDFSGTSKGSNNYTEYGRWCGLKNGYGPWCSAFISWVLYMADVPNAKVEVSGNYATDKFGGKFTPYTSKMKAEDFRKGDIIPCSWSGSSTANHVEIVYNNPEVDGVVKTISGNSGDGKVVKRTYNLLTQRLCKVFGYIRMN